MATRWPTLTEDGDGLLILDQTRLPGDAAMLRLATIEDAAHAIRVMQVRGAPLIGATAAYSGHLCPVPVLEHHGPYSRLQRQRQQLDSKQH